MQFNGCSSKFHFHDIKKQCTLKKMFPATKHSNLQGTILLFRKNYFRSQRFLMTCNLTKIILHLSVIEVVCYFSIYKLIGWASKYLLLQNHPTSTPHGFHVETTWKQSFPRCFNVESTWCVCRATTAYFSICKLIWWDLANIYFFKTNSSSTRKRYEICPQVNNKYNKVALVS